MKNIFRKLGDRRIAFFVCIAIYLVLWLVSVEALSDIYTFEWTSRNNYGYTWVAVVIFLIFDKTLPAYFITIGNVVGTIVGEFLGNFIIKQNLSHITSETSEDEIYLMTHTHQGWFIWIVTVLMFFVAGVILSIILNIRKKPHKKISADD